MVVFNKGKKILVIGKVNIFPKMNTFNSVDTEKLKKFKDAILSIPNLEVMDDSLEDAEESIVSLTDVSIRAAIKIIKETVNVEALETFFDHEEKTKKREKVLAAIQKQLDLI